MKVLDVISRIAGKVHLNIWHQGMPIGYSTENAGLWKPNEVPEQYYNYNVSTISPEVHCNEPITKLTIWKERD